MIMIKTKEDIAILREGGKRHAEIMRELAAMVKPGVTAAELNARADELIKAGGDKSAFLDYMPAGAPRPFPASLCVSVNDEVVHGIPNEDEKILKEGDIVTLDLGLVHRGMITDMAVTVPVGKVGPELEKLMETTKKALMAGIKAAKGGKRVGDISASVERVGVSGGYGIVEELSGHGVGYHVHEDPFVPNYGQAGKGPVLKPDMVIAIEPIFNLGERFVEIQADGYTFKTADGKPSAHFEHTVLIRKGEAEILTA
ncbi:MAG: type I methionyl aminopeptidase [Patescibacteria group bacterium]|nr:type I methionyl aminopeptidase [Patescibacteria group bacterium]